MLPADRQRNRPRPRAEVEHRAAGRQGFLRKIDQQFGFGARDQDIRRHAERQLMELAFAQQVGNRFTILPARRQAGKRRFVRVAQDCFGIRN